MKEADILKVIERITGAAKLEDAPLALAADAVRRLFPPQPVHSQPVQMPVEDVGLTRPENGCAQGSRAPA